MPPARPSFRACTGILSVWNDIDPAVEDFYEQWYMGEHFPERLGVPGFRRGRRYAAIEADRTYFTFYDLDTPEVLFSQAYLARLNAPTEWTRRIMGSWRGMFRTVCQRIAREGEAVGAYVTVARWEAPVALAPELATRLRRELADPAVVAVDVWQASARQNEATQESRNRPSADQTIAGAVVIEATRVPSAEKAAVALPKLLGALSAPAAIGIYGLIALQDSEV